MKLFIKKFLRKQYEVYLSSDKQHIQLHSNGKPSLTIEIRDVLNFHYFKQLAGQEKYWLNLKTGKNGKLFFLTQFSDESFVKDFVGLIPSEQLKEMENRSLKRHLYYYALPLILLGVYLANIKENKFKGLLVLGLFFFIFNSIAIYNEYSKFKKYKIMKQR